MQHVRRRITATTLRRCVHASTAYQSEGRSGGMSEAMPVSLTHLRQAPVSLDVDLFKGFELEFLGTGSQAPSLTRNTSSLALRLAGQVWMVDCGEGTQRQVTFSMSPYLTAARLTRIFITHVHGDHIFGLPGIVLASLAVNPGLEDETPCLEIIGPRELHTYIISSLKISEVKLKGRLSFVELISESDTQTADVSYHVKNRIHVNVRRILPDKDGVWHIPDSPIPIIARGELGVGITVQAMKICHTVDCWGYVFKEPDRPGSIDAEKVTAMGLRPSKYYTDLKNGDDVQLANGTIIRSKDVVQPAIKGRKVTILGDTNDASAISDLAKNSDVVVHDCTLPPTLQFVKSRQSGHSGPFHAAKFAKLCDAKKLILNHVGQRVIGRNSMEHMIKTAQDVCPDAEVYLAEDFDLFQVPLANTSEQTHFLKRRGFCRTLPDAFDLEMAEAWESAPE